MEILTQVATVAVLVLPAFVTALTQLLKVVPLFPTTSSNAKLTAFVISVILVGFTNHTIFLAEPLIVAGEVVATYGLAVGFYETCKALLKKLK